MAGTTKKERASSANRDATQQHSAGSDHTSSGSKSAHTNYATQIRDIRQATTVKHNQVFVLTSNTGDILERDAGYGMYFRDTCFLDQWELSVHGQSCTPLLADASAGSSAVFEATNPALHLRSGATLDKEQISIRRVFELEQHLRHTIELRNLGQEPITLEIELRYGSHFLDMFTIRGSEPGKRGTLRPPSTSRGKAILAYDGADGHTRTTTIAFAPHPDDVDGQRARYQLTLKPVEPVTLICTFELEDAGPDATESDSAVDTRHTHRTGAHEHENFSKELAATPAITTSNPLFDRTLARSLADIQMLATVNQDDLYVAAGIPWYVALFGRDSCITAYETLAFYPSLAKTTLRLLARYQGSKYVSFQDEEPGKILHELRVGERANLHEVPMIPYYGTVDATPWFLMLLAEYVRWTGDLALFKELRSNVEHALRWIDANESDETNIPGYLSYGSRSQHGLANQGWKDSDNGIVNADGSLCQPPIALVEVQGYVYQARLAMARLYNAEGDTTRAEALTKQAAELRKRFNDDFWVDDDSTYALCLQRDRRLSKAVTSNAGQTLFTRIASAEHARAVADRMMQEDMFCGWGVRTLSAKEKAYNPLDYQTGSVWPHDNALIALGLRRWGFADAMVSIFTGIFEAATQFSEFRLPEVFDGFSRKEYSRPVHYPVACSPQAWASGAIPLLLQTALGLEPDALHGTLCIHRPHLPEWLKTVEIHQLRVGDAEIDLRYRREDGTTLVAVLGRRGEIDISVQY